jgi:hypothetical protein
VQEKGKKNRRPRALPFEEMTDPSPGSYDSDDDDSVATAAYEKRLREENMRKVRPVLRVRRTIFEKVLTQMTSCANNADNAR